MASASPRRQELLAEWGLEFTQFSPKVDEKQLAGESPKDQVMRLALSKARAAVASQVANTPEPLPSLILAGDTLVSLGGQPLGKPANLAEARSMLHALSGRTHQVLSAYCLLEVAAAPKKIQRLVSTKVHFRVLPTDWIEWYLGHHEVLDKAGAYAIQSSGGAMVEWIHGSYTNVIGFPMEQIIWDLLKNGWLILADS